MTAKSQETNTNVMAYAKLPRFPHLQVETHGNIKLLLSEHLEHQFPRFAGSFIRKEELEKAALHPRAHQKQLRGYASNLKPNIPDDSQRNSESEPGCLLGFGEYSYVVSGT